MDQASDKALKRWRGDSFRLQPYQYEGRNLVLDRNGPRRPTPEEQLRMMGFVSTHLNTKARLSNDAKGQMIGNSFSAIVVARLLVGLIVTADQCQGKDVTLNLWHVWKEKEEKARLEDKPWKVRFASVAAGIPGVVSLASQVLPPPAVPLRSWIDPQEWLTDEEMLAYFLQEQGRIVEEKFELIWGCPTQWASSVDRASTQGIGFGKSSSPMNGRRKISTSMSLSSWPCSICCDGSDEMGSFTPKEWSHWSTIRSP